MNTRHASPARSNHGSKTPDGGHREHWRIDPSRSALEFSLQHVVLHEISGRFERWGGDLLLDHDDPARSAARVWVDLASIDTMSPERDAHIRSPEFLDVSCYPRAQFASTAIEMLDDGAGILTGQLALHGVTAPVAMRIDPGAAWRDPDGTQRRAYTATGQLSRQDFGLRWNLDPESGGGVLGDKIDLAARFELILSEGANRPGGGLI